MVSSVDVYNVLEDVEDKSSFRTNRTHWSSFTEENQLWTQNIRCLSVIKSCLWQLTGNTTSLISVLINIVRETTRPSCVFTDSLAAGELHPSYHLPRANNFGTLVHRVDWKYQIKPWVEKGYRVVVPDMLGYGQTDKPENPEEYSLKKISDDLASILRKIGVDKAVSPDRVRTVKTWEMTDFVAVRYRA